MASCSETGHIDLLVNNAGVTVLGAIEETDVRQAVELFDVNFFGAGRVTRAVLPSMRAERSGRIVFVSSGLGFLNLTQTAGPEGFLAMRRGDDDETDAEVAPAPRA